MKNETKVFTTLSISKQAQDVMLDNGYASQRTMGAFVSRLILDFHTRRIRKLTPDDLSQDEIVRELKRLLTMLERSMD